MRPSGRMRLTNPYSQPAGLESSALHGRDHGGGDHPIPFRTRQLSPPSPKVLRCSPWEDRSSRPCRALSRPTRQRKGAPSGRLFFSGLCLLSEHDPPRRPPGHRASFRGCIFFFVDSAARAYGLLPMRPALSVLSPLRVSDFLRNFSQQCFCALAAFVLFGLLMIVVFLVLAFRVK